jgi:HD-like signal output (HDOD) protein
MSTAVDRDAETAAGEGVDSADPRSLSEWVQKLGDSGMPVFANTARDISRLSDSRESSAAELARVVLQDAAMTAKLLRVANSPVFNFTGKSISTVSRAVVLLGFDEVRSICLSIAVVESMLKGKQKQRVIEEMARSFHAAVQARAIARKRKDPAPEEVFIATLLSRLGDMAFWAFAGRSAERLDTALKQRSSDGHEAVQRQVLGFTLTDLTLGLSREWKLGELLEQSLQGRSDRNPRAGNVILGYQLASAAEHGWDVPEVKRLVERIAENLYLPVPDVTNMVRSNADEAANTAAFYGAAGASQLIPVVRETVEASDVVTEQPVTPVFLEPDPMLQLAPTTIWCWKWCWRACIAASAWIALCSRCVRRITVFWQGVMRSVSTTRCCASSFISKPGRQARTCSSTSSKPARRCGRASRVTLRSASCSPHRC